MISALCSGCYPLGAGIWFGDCGHGTDTHIICLLGCLESRAGLPVRYYPGEVHTHVYGSESLSQDISSHIHSSQWLQVDSEKAHYVVL